MSWEEHFRKYEKMKYDGEIRIDYILIPSRTTEELKRRTTAVGCEGL